MPFPVSLFIELQCVLVAQARGGACICKKSTRPRDCGLYITKVCISIPSKVQATCHTLEKHIQVGSYKKLFTKPQMITLILPSFIQG